MPEATCPCCHQTFYGWAIRWMEKIVCPYCGALSLRQARKQSSAPVTIQRPQDSVGDSVWAYLGSFFIKTQAATIERALFMGARIFKEEIESC